MPCLKCLIHLADLFKKKIGEILGNCTDSLEGSESEDLSPKSSKEKEEPKKEKNDTRLKPSTPTVPPILKKWFEYCDKKHIAYSKRNISYWQNQLNSRMTIDQQKAIYTAIDNLILAILVERGLFTNSKTLE